jgi:hypothetical protein
MATQTSHILPPYSVKCSDKLKEIYIYGVPVANNDKSRGRSEYAN